MSSAKTAEPIEMPFGRSTHVGSGSRVLDGGPDLPTGRGTIEGDKYRPIVTYALRTVCLLRGQMCLPSVHSGRMHQRP